MKSLLFLLCIVCTSVLFAQQPGTIDKSYGPNNTGTVSVYNQAYVTSSVIQPDNKLVLGGYVSGIEQLEYTVIRRNIDGSIDTSFGTSGQTIITIDDLLKDQVSYSDGLRSIALQPDGKIVATGSVLDGDYDIVVLRFLADGTPDESFGSQGRVVTDLGYMEFANSIAVQADGKIVVSGYQTTDIFGNGSGVLVVRYNADGSLDNSFGGGNGYVKYTQQRGTEAFAMLIQPDGKIVAGGSQAGVPGSFFLVRYQPDGTLDASFGSGGAVTTPIQSNGGGTQINSLALDDKERIVAAGTVGASEDVAVTRYLPDGELDNSFNQDGQVELNFKSFPFAFATKVMLQPDNKLVISSLIEHYTDTLLRVVLNGLNEDGSVDSSFGTNNGQTITNIGFTDNISADAAMQSDDKIIVSGNQYGNTNINTYLLTRFIGYPVQVSLAVRIKKWLHNHGITWNGLPAEDKIAYYSVEQSNNSRRGFAQVAKVSGRSNLTDYSITNSNLLQGMNYYRVKAVSTDGTIRYSEVVSADNTAASASVFPNPARDYVTVQGLSTNATANISIADGSGNVMAKGVSNGGTQYSFQIGNLYPGTYYINITTGSKTEVLKFVKE